MKGIHVLLAAMVTMPLAVHATITTTENATITAIFGSGNPDTGWKEVSDDANNIQLGLRAKERNTGSTANDGAGNYTVASPWNVEFSVNVDPNNTGGISLASTGYSYYLSLDNLGSLDLLTYYNDNAYGDNATANGAGIDGTAATSPGLQSTWSIMQNSEREIYFGLPTDGSGHTFSLSVKDATGKVVVSDSINVNGGFAPVPEPTTWVAGALMLTPFAFGALRRLRKQESV